MTAPRILREAPASTPALLLVRATVVSTAPDGDRAELHVGGTLCAATVALGCLIRPLPGDSVLVLHEEGGSTVLQVLDRAAGGRATLALAGGGCLAIEGEALSLSARRDLSLAGERIDLRGRSLALMAETTTWLGKVLTGVVERFTLSARHHQTNAETLLQKAIDRTVVVDGTDSLRAETQLVTVNGVATETAHTKVIAAVEDLRMDGKRIAMG